MEHVPDLVLLLLLQLQKEPPYLETFATIGVPRVNICTGMAHVQHPVLLLSPQLIKIVETTVITHALQASTSLGMVHVSVLVLLLM